MKPLERLLLCAAILLAAIAVLRSSPTLSVARGAEPAHADATSPIAVCDIWKLSYDLARSDRYADRRKEYELAGEEVSLLYGELESLRDKVRASEPGTRSHDKLQRQFEELSSRYSKERERTNALRDKAFGEIMMDARDLVVSSAAAIAEDRGFGYVIASKVDDERPEKVSYMNVWRSHAGAPVVHSPEAADITIDVRDDLNLE